MKSLILVTIILLGFCLSSSVIASIATQKVTVVTEQSLNSEDYDAWLKDKFSAQHEKLIPIVAVADMFYACNQQRKIDKQNYQLKELIIKMNKDELAEKLAQCLANDAVQSDVALNFGLLGCFHEQLAHLPEVERQQKMALVEKAILSLSRNERKKSFTQCVTEQAIHYLQ